MFILSLLSRQKILHRVVNLVLNSILPKYLPILYEGTFPFQAPRIFQKMHASSLCREFLEFCLWSLFLPLIYSCHIMWFSTQTNSTNDNAVRRRKSTDWAAAGIVVGKHHLFNYHTGHSRRWFEKHKNSGLHAE